MARYVLKRECGLRFSTSDEGERLQPHSQEPAGRDFTTVADIAGIAGLMIIDSVGDRGLLIEATPQVMDRLRQTMRGWVAIEENLQAPPWHK